METISSRPRSRSEYDKSAIWSVDESACYLSESLSHLRAKLSTTFVSSGKTVEWIEPT